MARTKPFDLYRDQYEEWFVQHQFVFESEIDAIRHDLPEGHGVEIRVGTGLFAQRLRIVDGAEPSPAMAFLAMRRGVHVCRGVAEELPYHDGLFDLIVGKVISERTRQGADQRRDFAEPRQRLHFAGVSPRGRRLIERAAASVGDQSVC
jgi:hypothetical protein